LIEHTLSVSVRSARKGSTPARLRFGWARACIPEDQNV